MCCRNDIFYKIKSMFRSGRNQTSHFLSQMSGGENMRNAPTFNAPTSGALYRELANLGCLLVCLFFCCSCSTVGSFLTQLPDSITGGEETKQGRANNRVEINAEYFEGLLGRSEPGAYRRDLVRIMPLSKKLYNNSDLGGVAAFAVADNGDLVVIGENSRVATFFSTGIDKPIAAALSLRSGYLALADSATVKLFDIRSGEQKFELTQVRSRINSLDFDSSGETLLLGGTDARVYRWKFHRAVETFKEKERVLERYVGHASVISQVRYHPRERVFFSADWSGKVNAWVRYDADAFEGEYLKNATVSRPFTAESLRVRAQFVADGTIEAMEGSGDGELLAIASDKGQVSLLLVRGFRALAFIQAHRGLIYDMAFRDDGRQIVTVGRDDMLRVWTIEALEIQSSDPTEAKITLAKEVPMPGAHHLALNSAGSLIVGFKNGDIRVLSSKELLSNVNVENPAAE